MDSTADTLVKPQLRGVSHQIAFFVAAIAGTWLISRAQGAMFWGSVVYVFSLCGQFAASALYHRPKWGPVARSWWRRADHSFIVILIGGSGTPLALALPPEASRSLLIVVWTGAALGVLRAMVWINAPKPVAALVALVLAWFSAPFLSILNTALGPVTVWLLLAGGVLYSVGALAYALKRPNPWPTVFGYHEIFHVFVILAAGCHFVAIARVVLGNP